MAKKKLVKKASRNGSSTVRNPRKEQYSAERLRSVVEHLREQSMRLAGLARGMDDASVQTIQVDGHAMLMRGLTQVDNFADNCSRAVREAKSRKLAK